MTTPSHHTPTARRYPMPWAPATPTPLLSTTQLRPARQTELLVTYCTQVHVPAYLPTLDTAQVKCTRMTDAEVRHIMSGCREAAHAMATGKGTRVHWQILCGALTMARAIDDLGAVLRGLGGHLDDIEATLHALATGAGEDDHPPTWHAPALRFDEMDNIRLLAELYKTQLDQLSYAEYQAAHRLALARVRSGGGEVVNADALKGLES